MPYIIKGNNRDGFRVCKKFGNKCFSKKTLTKEKATKQLKAIGMSGKGTNKSLFNLLKKEGIEPKLYLDLAKLKAKKWGYDPKLLKWANDDKKKLSYNGIEFGSSKNRDYIIYLLNAIRGKYDIKKAEEKQNSYYKRALNTALKTKNINSPAFLSLLILW